MKWIRIWLLFIVLAVGAQAQRVSHRLHPQRDYEQESRLWNNFNAQDRESSHTQMPTRQGTLRFRNQLDIILPTTQSRDSHISYKKYMIIVEEQLYTKISDLLTEYASIVSRRMQVNVRIITVNVNANPIYVRNLLAQEYNVLGSLLIGDVPYAQFQMDEQEKDEKNSCWPCDLFYMDLDGDWFDNKKNDIEGTTLVAGTDGIYDTHSGNISPEIFIGRIPFIMGVAEDTYVSIVRAFIDKLLLYWSTQGGAPYRALNYMDSDWAREANVAPMQLFERSGFEVDYIDPIQNPLFSKADYQHRIQSQKYSFVHLWAHSTYYYHEFKGREELFNRELFANNSFPRIYNLFCCSANRWNTMAIQGVPCVGASYLFAPNSNTLSVLGSTKVGSMLYAQYFNQALSGGESVGYSFLQWWKSILLFEESFLHQPSLETIHWFYGLCILGDPLVHLPGNVDLFIKDDPSDNGITPNSWDDPNYVFWESDDIWIRNEQDGVPIHQSPIYNNGKPVYVYTRIHNRGTEVSSPSSLYLRFSHAGISLDYNSFLGLDSLSGFPTGGAVNKEPLLIPSIPPGSSVVVSVPWYIPSPALYERITGGKPWHFCLLAEVHSSQDPIHSRNYQNLNFLVKLYNNIAMKNVYSIEIGNSSNSMIGGIIAVKNPYKRQGIFDVELQEVLDGETQSLLSLCEVSIADGNLIEKLKTHDVLIDPGFCDLEETCLKVNQKTVRLKDLFLEPRENSLAYVQFNFKSDRACERGSYRYRVIFRDKETGQIVGGESFQIKKEPIQGFDASAEYSTQNGEKVWIARDVGELAKYVWRDAEGSIVGNDRILQKNDAKGVAHTLEVEAISNGLRDYYTLPEEEEDVPFSFRISPNPAKDLLLVAYEVSTQNALLRLISLTSPHPLVYPIDPTQEKILLHVGHLPRGKYVISLLEGDTILSEELIDLVE